MKRELYGDRGIWLGKKNYCIKMIDKEGTPKTKKDKPYVKGYDIAKKAATSSWIINKLNEYLEFIFYNNSSTELIQFERNAYNEYCKLTANEIFKPKSVSSLDNYKSINDKGVPAHIKGAIIYNKIINDNNLNHIYPIIYQSHKIKYCYVLPENCLNTHCISVQNTIDINKFMEFVKKEYNINIDYKKMWETDFIKPVRRLSDALNINMKNSDKISFLSLFSNN